MGTKKEICVVTKGGGGGGGGGKDSIRNEASSMMKDKNKEITNQMRKLK